jgi:hypothetical protein
MTPPFGYSPELPLRRSGGPKARPAHPPARLPRGIARSLRRLRGLHLRLSLCRVTLTPGCDSRLARIDDPSLIAELADDGSLIVIFIQPQGIDDETAAGGVCTRLEQSLRQHGVPLGALRIAILHCDAAAVDESDTTLDAVMHLTSWPLLRASDVAAAVSS